jgi:Zn-dependent peptidase ImmA (M78 family)
MMAMDELSVAVRAREYVNKVAPASLPVSVEAYAADIGAKIKKMDLGEDEDGFSAMGPNGNYGICVNRAHSKERQRFTVCHELAHIILGLPSEHGSGPSWSYAKRSPNEILCDVFASELLLPFKLFKPMVDKADFSLAEIDRLANEAEASVLATGSRFAAFTGTPCVFVFAENGKVRYCSRSTTLRAANAWIPPRMELPEGSLARRVRGGAANDGAEEVEADIWFEDWTRGDALMEDARHVAKYDQTIVLLWFEDDNVPPPREGRREREVDEFGLAELDGVLPWPGGKKRRR